MEIGSNYFQFQRLYTKISYTNDGAFTLVPFSCYAPAAVSSWWLFRIGLLFNFTSLLVILLVLYERHAEWVCVRRKSWGRSQRHGVGARDHAVTSRWRHDDAWHVVLIIHWVTWLWTVWSSNSTIGLTQPQDTQVTRRRRHAAQPPRVLSARCRS